MKFLPIALVLLALMLIVAAVRLEFDHVMWLGFPDGSTTPYDVAVANTYWTFNRFTLALAVWLVFLAWRARRHSVMRALLATAAFYAVAIFVVIALDRYFAATLPGPWGG